MAAKTPEPNPRPARGPAFRVDFAPELPISGRAGEIVEAANHGDYGRLCDLIKALGAEHSSFVDVVRPIRARFEYDEIARVARSFAA